MGTRHVPSLVFIALFAAACGGSTPTDNGGPVTVPVASVSISGGTGPLTPNQTLQLTATPKDAAGNPLSGRTVTWTSEPAAVATVNSTGLVTAVAAGTASITATSEGKSGSVTITVNPAPVASVTIAAPKTAFVVGDIATFTASTKDAQGNVLSGRTVTWASDQVSVAAVSSTGVVTALTPGTATITATSEGIVGTQAITVAPSPAASLLEQRVLAQQGLAIALASTVLQSQLITLIVVGGADASTCQALPGGGGFRLLTVPGDLPAQVNIYFDGACTRVYMKETVTTFTADTAQASAHILATAEYTGPTGTVLGSIAFDENATNIALTHGVITGTVNGLGTYTSATGAPSVRLGLDCNFGVPGHNIGICQGGIAQNFPSLATSLGSVATLALDSTSAGVITFTGGSVLRSGALDALTLTEPTATSMVVAGGSAYGTATAGGGAATFSLFPPTPTGWSVTDAANDQVFSITVTDNVARTLAGTLKQISTGATLATIALDQSGTGTITYSDSTSAPVTSWMLSR